MKLRLQKSFFANLLFLSITAVIGIANDSTAIAKDIGVGGGCSISGSHSKASRSYSYGMSASDIHKDRLALILTVNLKSVGDAGEVT
jgi:hypothetical protein